MEGALFVYVYVYESLVAGSGSLVARNEQLSGIHHLPTSIHDRAWLVKGERAAGGKSGKFMVWGQRSFKPLRNKGFQGEKKGFGVRGQNWA
jgi:hypothetical protein